MKTITIFASLLCFGFCNAQFSYGLKGGLVLTTITAGETVPIEPENKISYSLGAFSEYKFSDFSVNLGLSYGEFGSKGIAPMRQTNNPDGEMINPDINVKENMLVLDLTANYYIIESLSIGAGGYYGSITKVEHDTSGYENMDTSDSYEKNDYGLVFKADYKIYNGLFAEVKYNLGLANVMKPNRIAPTLPSGFKWDDEIKNRFLTVSLGYRFN